MPALITCGMAAVGSAVIGAPISGVIIMLELTMSYEYTLAAMLSIVLSLLVSHHLFGLSFYDRQLQDRGIDISKGRAHLQVSEAAIKPIMRQDYLSFRPEQTIADAMRSMTDNATTEAYILGDNKYFMGKVVLHKLLMAPPTASLSDHMIKETVMITENASLLQSIELASDFVGEHIPVIDPHSGRLAGIVSEADIFQAYLNLQTQIASR